MAMRNYLAACACAFALTLGALTPLPAQAAVLKADIIGDSTVEELGFTVAQCPSIEAEHACLMDSNGTIYFQRDAQSPAQIASITKVMTAIVAIENVQPNTIVTVSEKAALIGESSAGLQQGDKMDFETALKALLVPSGNDAAVALAETVGAQMIEANPSLGSDPEAVFVAAMNAKAAELGLSDTVYENPHGLDDDQYAGNLHSTAADQAKVAAYAMKDNDIREIVHGGDTSIIVDRGGAAVQLDLETTDELLEMYRYAIGIKTGSTLLAGPSFTGAANSGGIELYAVVLNSTDPTQRFYDAQALFEWGFEHICEVSLANSPRTTTMSINGESMEVPILAYASLSDWTDKTVPVTLENPKATYRVFDLFGNVSQTIKLDDIHGAVKAGQVVGTITYYQHNEVLGTMNLIACEDVAAPETLDSIGIWWTRFTAGITGAQTEAEDVIVATMPIIKDNTAVAA